MSCRTATAMPCHTLSALTNAKGSFCRFAVRFFSYCFFYYFYYFLNNTIRQGRVSFAR